MAKKASTRIETVIEGKDRTAKTFNDVAKKARQTQKAMSGGFGGSMAGSVAAGQALFSAVSGIARRAASAAAELGTLSDRAQQMQVTSEYAQQLERALGQVGIKDADLDHLTKAFDRMQMATGKVGAEGFESTLASIAAMGNEQERVLELGRIFGRQMGPSLAPLLRQGPDAFKNGLKDVMAGMPAVKNAAVDTGDEIADAWAIMNDEIKVSFQSMIGSTALYFKENFGMSVEETLRTAVVWVKWAVAVGWGYFKAFGENIGMLAEFFTDDWKVALDWVVGGISAFAKASLSPFIWIFDTVKGFAIEFGKSFVKWITGDEADWSGALEKALAKMGDASKEFKAAWSDLKPTAPPGREWAKVELDDLANQRKEALAIMKRSIAAKAQLASAGAVAGADVAAAGNKAAKAISDSLKDAKYVSASSYDALKLLIGNRRAAGTDSIVTQSLRSSAASGNMESALPLLREILGLQRDGWRTIANLEAV